MKQVLKNTQFLLDQGLIPDSLIRFGIRGLLKEKLREEKGIEAQFGRERFMQLIDELKKSPIAVKMQDANRQHYELPTEFFKHVLGKYMKYSGCYWPEGTKTLDQAEEATLKLYAQRAQIENGHTILDLGCGWGSFSLYAAERFPRSEIAGVSNSKTQKAYIDGEIQKRGIKNLEIITSDINDFQTHKRFDRAVSIEMFEHLRNYEKLLQKIASWMNPEGKLFVHIFTHHKYAYFYDETDEADWIGKYFFTGGMMPSDDLLLYFQNDFQIQNHWHVSGTHYQKTAEAWLKKIDQARREILPIFEKTYGSTEAKKWLVRWRVFILSCAELWGYKNGTEWLVSHYLFEKR